MTNTITAIIDLKVRLEAGNRMTRSKSFFLFVGALQMICMCALSILESPMGTTVAVAVSFSCTMYYVIEIKNEALAPIVDALLEIEERLDSDHD